MDPPSGWSLVTSTTGGDVQVVTTSVSAWPTLSRASVGVTVGVATDPAQMTVITPVYALGSPTLSPVLTTVTPYNSTDIYITAPMPTCKYSAAIWSYSDCGQCTMTGGTVELYYWPPATLATVGNYSQASATATSDTKHRSVQYQT